jgi:hypothetical protein
MKAWRDAASLRGPLGAVVACAVLGCRDATGPEHNSGLPRSLTLRVGAARDFTPKFGVEKGQGFFVWESSDPSVVSVSSPDTGCTVAVVIVTCERTPGLTATVVGRAPGQATVEVRWGRTVYAAVVVTVVAAAP